MLYVSSQGWLRVWQSSHDDTNVCACVVVGRRRRRRTRERREVRGEKMQQMQKCTHTSIQNDVHRARTRSRSYDAHKPTLQVGVSSTPAAPRRHHRRWFQCYNGVSCSLYAALSTKHASSRALQCPFLLTPTFVHRHCQEFCVSVCAHARNTLLSDDAASRGAGTRQQKKRKRARVCGGASCHFADCTARSALQREEMQTAHARSHSQATAHGLPRHQSLDHKKTTSTLQGFVHAAARRSVRRPAPRVRTRAAACVRLLANLWCTSAKPHHDLPRTNKNSHVGAGRKRARSGCTSTLSRHPHPPQSPPHTTTCVRATPFTTRTWHPSASSDNVHDARRTPVTTTSMRTNDTARE